MGLRYCVNKAFLVGAWWALVNINLAYFKHTESLGGRYLNEIVPVDKCYLPVMAICLYFNLLPLVWKHRWEITKKVAGFKMFAKTTYLCQHDACGGTFFEQDWQSLICPDGADREVRGLYIWNPKLQMVREWENGSHRSIWEFKMSMIKKQRHSFSGALYLRLNHTPLWSVQYTANVWVHTIIRVKGTRRGKSVYPVDSSLLFLLLLWGHFYE